MPDQGKLYENERPDLSGIEQTIFDSIEKDEPWELLEELCELRRISPSEDEMKAAELIENCLDSYDVPYNRYDPEFFLSVPHGAEVRIPETGESWSGSDDDFEDEQPLVKVLAFSAKGPVLGDAVYLDISSPEDDKGALEGTTVDTSGMDLEDKIVVTDTLTVSKRFFKDIEDAGAKALVCIHPYEDEPLNTTVSPIWGAIPHPDEKDLLPNAVYPTVAQPVGDRLFELFEKEGSFELEVEADLTEGWFECPLVLGRIPGEAAPDNDDFVLLHGHLDSWFYGATDNATGNVAKVELARVLNEHRDQFKRDLWIAFWPAHEGGRYGGSTWFVDEFAQDLADNCVAHVNLDSPGTKDATEYLSRVKWMAAANDLCIGAIDDVTGKSTQRHRPARAGDYAFNNIGIPGMSLQTSIPKSVREARNYPAIGGSGGNSRAWHRTTDTIEEADPDVLQRDTRVFGIVLSRLLQETVLPLNHCDTIERHREIVADHTETAKGHLDLSSVLEELSQLETAVNSFYDQIDSGEVDSDKADDVIRRLSQRLVQLNFAEEGRFEQDPAYQRPPYPRLDAVSRFDTLDGDDYRFLKTHLRRARNHVVHELREANRELP